TIEAWVMPTTVDSVYRAIVSKERPSDPRNGYLMWIRQESGTARFGFERRFSTPTATSTIAVVPLPITRFVHLVGTYDGTRLTIYVDGAMVEVLASSHPLEDQNGLLVWGATDYAAAPFEGSLDELAIYDKVLPAGRIAAHHTLGSP